MVAPLDGLHTGEDFKDPDPPPKTLYKLSSPPRSPGGKPQRLTARVKIARAPVFPTASFCRRAIFGFAFLCVCVSVVPERRPKFGSKSDARCSLERGNPNFSTGRRGFDVTATLLALLERHKSRRRRAPRPAAGPPTHAIAGTRARAVTMATDRPPSLLNHSRRLALKLPCATTLSSLDAAVVTRRRRRVTSFAFPSGRAPTGAFLHLRLPLQRRARPGAEYADSFYGSDCADCGPRFPPPALLRPRSAPRRETGLPTPIATTAAPARVPPGPGRRHVGPDHRLMWYKQK